MKQIITIICLLLPTWVLAQLQIKGNVKQNNTPVAWANVILTSPEGKMITGALTKEDGTFELKAPAASYILKVTFLGLREYNISFLLDKNTDLGTISMKEKSGELNEVVVTARKKMIKYKADRLVFNVENSINATGGNGLNAIQNAPGIVVLNGNISILGKGASRVMIDGRLVELTGQDLIDYLSTLSAADIKSIEVMANPPAKYDAGSDGGLINIILKKGAANAWKNTTAVSADQQTYNAFTLRDNFFYNRNKVKLSANAGGQLGAIHAREDINTYYPSGPWMLTTAGKQKETSASGGVTFDYDVSNRTTVGVQYLGSFGKPDMNNTITIGIHNPAGKLDSLLINNARQDITNTSHTANAHLVSNLDTAGRKLSVDLDLFTFNSKFDNNFVANTFDPAGKFLNLSQAARNISNQNIRNGSFKIDMEHPLRFMNLSYGAKISTIDSKAGIQYYNTASGKPELDPNRSNDFEYQEHNQAVYVNSAKDFNQQFSAQIGLRLEHTSTKGYSVNNAQTNTNSYMKLFPTVFLSYKTNKDNTFLLNYGKRINRPGFRNLNPFRSYINSNSYSEGNPFLQPSFSDNFELSHVFKGAWRTNLFLNITSNGYGTVFTSDPATNTQIITRQNYYKEMFYGIGETYTGNITPWWQTQINVNLLGSNTRFISNINATPLNGFQFYGTTNNTFNLGSTTALQVDYTYSSPVKRGLFTVGYISGLNIGVRQSLLNKQLNVTLLVNDVFNTANLKDYASVVNGIKQVYAQNYSSRYVRLSLTYSFGNHKIDVKKRNQGNAEEIKRAGQ